MQPQSQRNPIEIKISTVVAIAVILHDADLSVLAAALTKMTANSSDYYSAECAVIDVANIDCASMDCTAYDGVSCDGVPEDGAAWRCL